MELATLAGIIRRWLWLILSLAVVTGLVLGLRLRVADPAYEAQVKLQLTAPQQEDVTLFGGFRSGSARDEMLVARNNFVELLQSGAVRNRTVQQLGISDAAANYELSTRSLRDSDFIYVIVRAPTSTLAEEIANTHVNEAVLYYGEVRAKPAIATKAFLNEQLRAAEERLRSAEETLARFQTTNGIATLENELKTNQALSEQLRAQRNQLTIGGAPDATLQRIDQLLADLKVQQDRIVGLTPQYRLLEENSRQARADYQLLLNKHAEAAVKSDPGQLASFVHVIESANVASQPVSGNQMALLLLAVLGSLGAGVGVALLIETVRSAQAVPPGTVARAR